MPVALSPVDEHDFLDSDTDLCVPSQRWIAVRGMSFSEGYS